MSNVSQWSTTAGNNNAAPPNGWPEGQARSSVNDCAREMMAALARLYKDLNGSLVSGGTGNAYTLATNSAHAALADQAIFSFRADRANTGAVTLNVDGLGAKAFHKSPGAEFASGDIVANQIITAIYNANQDRYEALGNVVPTFAAQSDMEAAASVALPVTPGRQQFHPGHPKCWAYITVSAGTPNLQASYNITSIASGGTGAVIVTIATDFSSANWCPAMSVSGASAYGNFTAIAAGSITLNSLDPAGNPVHPSAYSFAGFGDI